MIEKSKIDDKPAKPGIHISNIQKICFGGWLFFLFILLYPIAAISQDFRGKEFKEPINVEYWRHNPGTEYEVLSHIEGRGQRFYTVIFHSPIDFSFAKFNRFVDFSNAEFRANGNFWNAHFRSMAELSNAIFYGDVSFVIAVFDSTANFALAKYKSRASFREARFDKDALFSVNNFELPIDFSRTVFNSSVFFNNSTFKSSVDFSGAVIQSNADFRWVQFHSSSNCTDARFGGTVDFSDGHFYENATFRWARFGDAVWFRNTILPDTMDFENVRYIEREIDFTNAKRPTNGKNCEIALLGSDIRKIKLNMELFHLWFPDLATFNQLNGKLDTVSVTFDQKRGVYESVLKKLKDDGLIESYKILDIEYQDTLYNRSGWFNRLVINNWQKVWWNYGYDKMRVFYCSFGLLLLFSFVNLPLYRKLASEVYSIDFVEKSVSTDMGRFRRWLLHLRKTTTYTTIIFFGLKMDLEKFRENVLSHHPWLLMYLMFVYLVGLVCLGFIANIILAR